jgi:hypothetical protein
MKPSLPVCASALILLAIGCSTSSRHTAGLKLGTKRPAIVAHDWLRPACA